MLRKFKQIKFVSKAMITTSLLLLLLNVSFAFLFQNRIQADESTEKLTYSIDAGKVYIGDPGDSNITKCKNEESECKYVHKVEEQCLLGNECYYMEIQGRYPDATIRPTPSPEWLLLGIAYDRAHNRNDQESINFIDTYKANYAKSAFEISKEVNFDYFYNNKTIYITLPDFFNDYYDGPDTYDEPYFSVYKENNVQTAKITFSDYYENPSEDSQWLKAVKYLHTRYILFWRDRGITELSGNKDNPQEWKLKEYLIYYEQIYLTQCGSGNDSNNIITFTAPEEIQLKETDVTVSPKADKYTFSVKINTENFSEPINGYKTKIFVKPAIRSAENKYIILPFTDTDISFTWQDIFDKPYQITNDGATTPFTPTTSEDIKIYNKLTPQQYLIKAVTFDNTSEKSSSSLKFNTVDRNMIFDYVEESEESRTGEILTGGYIVVGPRDDKTVAYNGETVTIDIKVQNNLGSPIEKRVSKIAAYICQGRKEEVESGISDTCTYIDNTGGTNTEEGAVKARFKEVGKTGDPNRTYNDFKFDNSGLAKLSFPWDTSGSSIGDHAVMVKTYLDGADGAYMPNSKRAATIKVSNTTQPAVFRKSGISGVGSGGVATSNDGDSLDTRSRASENQYGSKIRYTKQLVGVIEKYAYLFIGALAIIAIIIGGIQFISSAGNPDNAVKGKKTVMYGVIGIIIAVLAFVIENSVIDIINTLNK